MVLGADQVVDQLLVVRDAPAHQPRLDQAPHLGPLIGELPRLSLAPEPDLVNPVPQLPQPVDDPRAVAGVNAHRVRLVAVDGLGHPVRQLHVVQPVELLGRDAPGVPPSAEPKNALVRARPGHVHPQDQGGAIVRDQFPVPGAVGHVHADELLIRLHREAAVDLDEGLVGIRPVLVDDLLVDLRVQPLHRPRVDLLRLPIRPVLVERLEKRAGVAPGVAENEPVPMRADVREEALGHVPDHLGDAGRLVEQDHHAPGIVRSGERVRVILAPKLGLGIVILRVDPELLHQELREPVIRTHQGRRDLEPVGVQTHGHPLAELGPGAALELLLRVGGHDARPAEPGAHEPVDQPPHERALARATAGRHGALVDLGDQVPKLQVLILLDDLLDPPQPPPLPRPGAGVLLQRAALFAPGVDVIDEGLGVVGQGRVQKRRKKVLLVLGGILHGVGPFCSVAFSATTFQKLSKNFRRTTSLRHGAARFRPHPHPHPGLSGTPAPRNDRPPTRPRGRYTAPEAVSADGLEHVRDLSA